MFPATGVGIRSFVVISVSWIWVYQAHIPGNWHEIRQDISDVVVEHQAAMLGAHALANRSRYLCSELTR